MPIIVHEIRNPTSWYSLTEAPPSSSSRYFWLHLPFWRGQVIFRSLIRWWCLVTELVLVLSHFYTTYLQLLGPFPNILIVFACMPRVKIWKGNWLVGVNPDLA